MSDMTSKSAFTRTWPAWGSAMLLVAAALLLSTAALAESDSAAGDSTATPEPAAVPVPATPAPETAAVHPRPAFPTNVSPRVTSQKVKLDVSDENVVRTGPGERYAMAGLFPKGTVFPVIAKSGDWYNVRLSETDTGWFHASLCKVFDDLSDLEFKPNPKLYSRTGSYMLTGYAGAYAFDRKSNSFVAGGRVGYYIFDRLQAEGGLAWTHVRRPAEIVESLFQLSLEAEGANYIISGERWMALFPCAALMLAVFTFNLLGDGLRDIVDPQRRI
jgi:hypothetical protein